MSQHVHYVRHICCPRRHPTISSLSSCDNNHHSWDVYCSSCRQPHYEQNNQNIIIDSYRIIHNIHLTEPSNDTNDCPDGEGETKGND